MKFRLLLFALSFALATGATLAHGEKVHLYGTVEKIGSDAVLVKTKNGKSVEVKLVSSTVYLVHDRSKSAKPSNAGENKPAKLSDLAVGDTVVIHATPKNNLLEADEIKFSVPAPAKTATPAQPNPKP